MKSRYIVLGFSIIVVALSVGLWSGGWGDRWSAPREQTTKLPAPKLEVPVTLVPTPRLTKAPESMTTAAIAAETSLTPATPAMPTSRQSTAPPPNPPTTTKVDMDLGAEAAIKIDQIGLMFRDYRTLMGSNPVGTNAEIIEAVSGENPKKARLGPPDGQQLNGRGELMDAWGTAYFFHQKSATDMEIHSAGPDKQFGTSDDIIGR